jgi:hypothetical protein
MRPDKNCLKNFKNRKCSRGKKTFWDSISEVYLINLSHSYRVWEQKFYQIFNYDIIMR